jgi:hypothetical protein
MGKPLLLENKGLLKIEIKTTKSNPLLMLGEFMKCGGKKYLL